jgi:predicted nucleic acid-binding protein
VIYLDTSVALAHLLAEDRTPPPRLWQEELVASRLLEYELWTRLHRRGIGETHDAAQELLARLAFLEMTPLVLARAAEPFPTPVRTLDALHLASFDFLRRQGVRLALASYDRRQCAAAEALGFERMNLEG